MSRLPRRSLARRISVVAAGGPLSGTYTIPLFRHCGLNTVLLNLTIPGPGNTLA